MLRLKTGHRVRLQKMIISHVVQFNLNDLLKKLANNFIDF